MTELNLKINCSQVLMSNSFLRLKNFVEMLTEIKVTKKDASNPERYSLNSL